MTVVQGSGKLLRDLLDDAREGLLALDEHGAILEANEAAARFLKRERRHLLGKPFAAFVPLDRRRLYRHNLALTLRGEPTGIELPLGPDGLQSTVSMRLMLRSEPPRIAVALVSGAVHTRERPEHVDSTRPEDFFVRLPFAVVGLRSDLVVAFANPRALSLLGAEAVRVGRPLGVARIPIDLRQLGGNVVSRPTHFSESPIELPDGRTLRVTGIPPHKGQAGVLMLEDVSAQHRHDRVMREFVRNAAHQLRTPLTGITTAVEVLQSGAKNVPDDRDRFLEHIERHAGRLTRIARGLLVLARAQSGEQILRLEFVELQPLLQSLAADAEPAHGVTVEASCPPSLAALAEPNLVHEALSALVDNAVEHTRQGAVRLLAQEVDGRVEIDVLDNGPGILPEHQGRIFEPFYRTLELGDGFGLGLAIAAQAAEAMDGELRAAASPDGGTRFTIRLPSARVMS
jgi:two-component system, OmpR family, phosphate regulon sensor histidine kinase PhoR